jgi:hypothetical protein
MSSKQHVIKHDAMSHEVKPGPTLPRGWLGRARLIAFAFVFGIIGGTVTFLMTKNDRAAAPTAVVGTEPLPQTSIIPAKIEPATIEKIEGTELNRVTLSEKAMQRLDIQTAPVREEQVDATPRKVIPYAAVIYDLQGKTWAYTSPKPRTFVRHPITVEHIEGDIAVLADGPPVGSEVATVGVAELYGSDTGVGK